ncbi:thioredoxin reductase (NADPH) [Anaeroplasma bactoclasticum]|jgi:thioredoxin reductase (NADPH)|uniref:Thioredoxin reductase (NADPH) n=1 Tax=Anaeroplasma bactoclasticum TaxID=2088 RepID=A0A397S325_9MOLU|nr:NAD(P)/FAD-dependent oxidoreductase [Anaeroplasma bactoclasticum]RIA78357.1 thioredoxin reductase (NADPH) [Anaeroplasma bactoclasticum]
MYDAIIIGAGPAGISASLYLKRANKNVLVLYHGESELEKAHRIENYYGFPNGITGANLYQNGISQAKALGVDVLDSEVLSILMNEKMEFNVKTIGQEYQAKVIILATGNKKLKPNIKGVEEYEGRGISYCAICDGFFYRKKPVVVIGSGNYAISEATELLNVTSDVKILTNGLKMEQDTDIPFDERKIKEVSGEDRISYVLFEDDEKLECKGVFIALGEAGGADFAKKLGIYMEKDLIIVDENMKTTVPGVYAIGNVVGGLLQINKAVYEGAKAALDAIKYINEKR